MLTTARRMEQRLGPKGNIVHPSKSEYLKIFSRNLVVFNANVCVEDEKIWYGDIDITRSKFDLSSLAKDLNKTVYILYERDGRFENEESPKIDRSAATFFPSGKISLREDLSQIYGSDLSAKDL
jgi:hypothetical protein